MSVSCLADTMRPVDKLPPGDKPSSRPRGSGCRSTTENLRLYLMREAALDLTTPAMVGTRQLPFRVSGASHPPAKRQTGVEDFDTREARITQETFIGPGRNHGHLRTNRLGRGARLALLDTR